ncbi:MAG: hypothetical protein H7061_02890 [Bdellovibrionaceae bacterium]|nr:hypothetical protein [Bdellovibrio sp.]
MKTTLTRTEKTIVGVTFMGVVVFMGLFTQTNLIPKSFIAFDAVGFINYQMGRANEGYSEYSLKGRDVDHTYEGLAAKAAAAVKPVSTQAQIDAKKKADELKKKTTVAQKAKTKTNVPAAQVRPIAKNQVTVAKTPQVDTNPNNTPPVSAPEYANPVAVDTAPPVLAQPAVDKNKKSLAQWRAAIQASPTRETVTFLIEALRKNQISATDYQTLTQELINQPDEKMKGLGIMAARANPSYISFAQLMRMPATELTPAMKSYYDQALGAYMQPQNIAYLNQALMTNDKNFVGKTLVLLNSNLPKINQGDYSNVVDSRNLRGVEKSDFSVVQFKGLLPALNLIVSAEDPQLSPMAQQASSYIELNNQTTIVSQNN